MVACTAMPDQGLGKPVKESIFRLVLVLAGCLVSLSLAEIAVRIFFPHSRDHVVPGRLFTIDEDLGWSFEPDSRGRHRTRYFDVEYSINAFGFRDGPRGASADGGIHRCLLYGDSQTFGWGVAADRRFSNLIEEGSRRLEVWNLSVPGYGLDQEVLSYEKDGSFLSPGEVVFFVSHATIGRLRHRYLFKKHKPAFVLDSAGDLRLAPVPEVGVTATGVLYKLLSPLYLPYFLEVRLGMLKTALSKTGEEEGQRDPRGTRGAGTMGAGEEVRALARAILLRARDTALSRGHGISVLAWLEESQRRELKVFCERNGIGFLAIQLDRGSDLSFGKHDGHWNPETHGLIAEQLLPPFQRRAGELRDSVQAPNSSTPNSST